MKNTFKALIILLLCLITLCLVSCGTNREQYIRIHIRANSNETLDQTIKLEVRDAVIKYLEPLAKAAENKQDMMRLIQENIDNIQIVADKVLKDQSFSYTSTVKLDREDFPTKTYGELTLDAGEYDALIIALGSGTGDNWWCVAFPPLCLIPAEDNGTEEVVYKSKIAEWFDKIKN